MNKRLYPISVDFFKAQIVPLIESSKKKSGRPSKVDLYAFFCGVLYVLRTGISWFFLELALSAAKQTKGMYGYCLCGWINRTVTQTWRRRFEKIRANKLSVEGSSIIAGREVLL